MQVQRIQNNNQNTSFGVKLKFENINNCRWNKIAEKFEQATKEFPYDTLTISVPAGSSFESYLDGVFNWTGFFIKSSINNGEKHYSKKGYLSDKGAGLLAVLEDNAIVDKLIKLHKILRNDSDMSLNGYKMVKEFEQKYNKDNLGHAPSMFRDAIEEARKTSLSASLREDEVWARYTPEV